ncbi:hypothetical protein [uncultured Tenacibaculum sp.]|uniref:hypothetical protein n=1 Tax=uncultured Tenacibaculum sp. TaxID=174713 RepID=UPI0026177974|nr:hypothetical protein [uncultured Tenacibaculum sp.]
MKILKALFLVASVSLFLTSCGKETEEEQIKNLQLGYELQATDKDNVGTSGNNGGGGGQDEGNGSSGWGD